MTTDMPASALARQAEERELRRRWRGLTRAATLVASRHRLPALHPVAEPVRRGGYDRARGGRARPPSRLVLETVLRLASSCPPSSSPSSGSWTASSPASRPGGAPRSRCQAEAKEEARKIVSLWQSGEAFVKAGGKRERGILFLGAPGTGKTMLAKAIATGFNSPFVSIPGSGFAQTFIGVDALIVRYLARKAKKLARKWGGQCIAFIDEIGAVGMRRSSLGGGMPTATVPPSFHDHCFYGPHGALTPTGDLLLENRSWRDRLFAARAPEPPVPTGGRLGAIVDQMFPGMMGGGGQLALKAQPARIGEDVPVSAIAIGSGQPDQQQEDVKVFRTPNTVLYILCGIGGEQCATPEGTPSEERMLLLRREALELALHTFKYVDGKDAVLAILPPRQGESPSTAVYLRREDFSEQLARPLDETLLARDRVSASDVQGVEARRVRELTLSSAVRERHSGIYGFQFQQRRTARRTSPSPRFENDRHPRAGVRVGNATPDDFLDMRAATFLFAVSPVRSYEAAWARAEAEPRRAGSRRPRPHLAIRVRRFIAALASV